MTFGKWLVTGLEIALFVMNMTAYVMSKDPGFIILGVISMLTVALAYGVAVDRE